MQVRALVRRCKDYSNFEIEIVDECETIEEANELRRNAAILADQAVAEFVAMQNLEKRGEGYEYNRAPKLLSEFCKARAAGAV